MEITILARCSDSRYDVQGFYSVPGMPGRRQHTTNQDRQIQVIVSMADWCPPAKDISCLLVSSKVGVRDFISYVLQLGVFRCIMETFETSSPTHKASSCILQLNDIFDAASKDSDALQGFIAEAGMANAGA